MSKAIPTTLHPLSGSQILETADPTTEGTEHTEWEWMTEGDRVTRRMASTPPTHPSPSVYSVLSVVVTTPFKLIRLLTLPWMLVAIAHAQPQPVDLNLGGGISLELVAVPPGSFEQGSPDSEADRGPDESRRTVTFTRGFWIGRFPVTRAQFERFASDTGYRTEAEKGTSGGFGWDGNGLRQNKSFTWRTPGFPQAGDHPVTMVTHGDALSFCRWLKSKTGREFTLPTEAQWEYVCRAGTTSAWHSAERAEQASEIAWFKPFAENRTHPVASRKANPWGVHIGGNVAEWCLDWYGPYPPGAVTDPLQTNPNLSDKPRRVLRGGSWLREVQHTRSAARYRNDPGSRNADNGFRVVTIEAQAPSPPSASSAPPASTPPPSAPPAPSTQPAAVRPPPRPPPIPFETAHPPTSVPRSFGTWLVGGLFVMGLPALFAVIFLVRRLTVAGSRNPLSSLTSKLTGHSGRLSAPTPADDGFWFTSDASFEGARFLYSYWLNEQMHQGHVVYQPGPDGQQFVYTGSRPERVTLQAEPDTTPEALLPILPSHLEDTRSSPIDRLLSSGPFPPAY